MPPEAPAPSFVAMINAHQPLLQRVCRLYCTDRDERQDLFQEIVLQLWRAWRRYEPGAAKISTWLYRVALNVAISDLRRRNRRPAPDRLGDALPEVAAPAADGPDPEELAQLYRAIEQLSDVDKAFVLLYLEERSYEEMADILGLTQNHVRVKMHRIQEKIRQAFTRLVR